MKEIIKQFFSVNLKDYSNLCVDFEINKALVVLLVVLCISFFYIHVKRKNMYYIVKQLTRHNATDEESAKTLEALGLSNNFVLKWMLSGSGQLTRLVKRAGEVTLSYEEYVALEKEKKLNKEKIDFTEAKFYLFDAQDTRVQRILSRYNIPLFKTVILCVFVVVLYFCIMLLMPELLMLINYLVGLVKGMF